MPQLEDFVRTWEEEFRTTLRVFESYPSSRLEYSPHEVSKSAHELMWTIVCVERDCVGGCLKGKITWSGGKPPKTKEGLLAEYKKLHQYLVRRVAKAGEGFFAKTVKFFVAKGKMGDISIKNMLWGMLHDQIHHRGQLSVYLRLVGAKVPSIYGPTADEPW